MMLKMSVRSRFLADKKLLLHRPVKGCQGYEHVDGCVGLVVVLCCVLCRLCVVLLVSGIGAVD